ncbi:hypothetical protein [Maribellus sp. YY47]|uniref:hypothetical protein n=1 Tax=Maribellus sp. YY47 TaxID=2929486 RepID=UPI0020014EAF|nr:hypothetical protein [Maribellus sp. YY47]MCK3683319.1 hypothetical protein [Maribellus sp. YY47]
MAQKYLFIKMENQEGTAPKTSSKKRWLAFLLPVILLLVSIQYATLSTISVQEHLKMVSEIKDVDVPFYDVKDSAWISAFKDRNWIECRLETSKTDSISLSVNLKDSILQLELKGVVIKTTPIIELHADRFFEELNPVAYHHYFGEETASREMQATIEKIPLIVKKAPKDTLEYAAQSHVVDTLKREDVHWLIMLDNGIELRVEGTDTTRTSNAWHNKFWLKQDYHQIKNNFAKTLKFEVPQYNPTIKLVISENDAKAIYRALPRQPRVCIRL